MRIEKKQVDDLTFQLNLIIDKADCAERVRKSLNEYRRKADIRGFRKGMAPMSLIEKMHGTTALAESVNSLISESLNNYISENKLNILGEPLPNEELQKPIDWGKDTTYEFLFDLATQPQIKLELSKDDRLVYYDVVISDEARQNYRSNMLRQFGKLVDAKIVGEDDFIIADLEQNGTVIEGTYISLKSIKNETIKKKFVGKSVGSSFAIDVNRTFDNEADRAALLKIKKEELKDIDPNYNVTVKEIKTFAEAEQNQELYDRLFGKDVVKDEAGFNVMIEKRIAADYKRESDFRFMIDTRDYLIEKCGIRLPEQFLKRWLYTINEGKFTMEQIEKDFDIFLKDFRWQLIRQYIVKEQKIEIKREDLIAEAKRIAALQFAMYGLNDVPEERLEQYAESVLGNENEGRRVYEKTEEEKVLEYIKGVVTIEHKTVSIEDLQKMNN